MDKIIMKNLSFYGYHGVMAEENTIGQKFFIDVEIYSDFKKAGLSDNINDTVNYAQVYEIIKDITESRKYNLIEALAESIANTILNEFKDIHEILVNIKKPEAPVKGIFDYFAVEIRRKRNG